MISVIMSAYQEDLSVFVPAVTSILDQKGPSFELILVLDDPENTELASWVDENLLSDDRVRVLRNKNNLGLARSLNRAIENASGDFLCRMDADDIAEPHRLEKQLSCLREHELDLVGSRVNVVDAEGEFLYMTPQPPCTPEKVAKVLKWNNCLAHPTWFGRKEVFAQGYREIPLCEDYDFQIRAVLKGFKLGNCEDVTLSYRLSDEGLSRSSLYKQYLYQRCLTKVYKQGKAVDVDRAKEYVERAYTEKKARKYSQANDYFQHAMNALSQKRIAIAICSGAKSIMASSSYADKVRRLILASL